MIASTACRPVRVVRIQSQSLTAAFSTQRFDGIGKIWSPTRTLRIPWVSSFARSPSVFDPEYPTSASVWWLACGTGKLSQPAIAPLTVAWSGAGGFEALSGIVRFVPLTPIHVTGVWLPAVIVTVCGPDRPGQLSGWNFARPVESVTTWQGAGSDESPTRTVALERTSRVS